MTREQAKELLSIIQAFAEGNTIQEKIEGITGWEDTDEINYEFEGKKIIHRIKPEPKYRPFKTKNECWDEMKKHQPFGWVISIKTENFEQITYVGPNIVSISDTNPYFSTALDNYKFVVFMMMVIL